MQLEIYVPKDFGLFDNHCKQNLAPAVEHLAVEWCGW